MAFFYRFNAKNVNFILQKFCPCNKNDKLEVCLSVGWSTSPFLLLLLLLLLPLPPLSLPLSPHSTPLLFIHFSSFKICTLYSVLFPQIFNNDLIYEEWICYRWSWIYWRLVLQTGGKQSEKAGGWCTSLSSFKFALRPNQLSSIHYPRQTTLRGYFAYIHKLLTHFSLLGINLLVSWLQQTVG